MGDDQREVHELVAAFARVSALAAPNKVANRARVEAVEHVGAALTAAAAAAALTAAAIARGLTHGQRR